jgi:DNA-binding NarL/FixJ family response regulator
MTSTPGQITVLIAEDYALVRAGLQLLVDGFAGIRVVATVADGRSAIAAIATHRPDVALLDITMPGLGGIEALARITVEHPATHVLMLSMHDNENHVLAALRAGAGGYLLKGSDTSELEFAIRAVARGGSFLSPELSRRVLGNLVRGNLSDDPGGGLTPRQREIVQLIAEGHTNAEIAATLALSPKTIETHRADVMKRLDIHDVAGLVRYAIRSGLIAADI